MKRTSGVNQGGSQGFAKKSKNEDREESPSFEDELMMMEEMEFVDQVAIDIDKNESGSERESRWSRPIVSVDPSQNDLGRFDIMTLEFIHLKFFIRRISMAGYRHD